MPPFMASTSDPAVVGEDRVRRAAETAKRQTQRRVAEELEGQLDAASKELAKEQGARLNKELERKVASREQKAAEKARVQAAEQERKRAKADARALAQAAKQEREQKAAEKARVQAAEQEKKRAKEAADKEGREARLQLAEARLRPAKPSSSTQSGRGCLRPRSPGSPPFGRADLGAARSSLGSTLSAARVEAGANTAHFSKRQLPVIPPPNLLSMPTEPLAVVPPHAVAPLPAIKHHLAAATAAAPAPTAFTPLSSVSWLGSVDVDSIASANGSDLGDLDEASPPASPAPRSYVHLCNSPR